MHCFGRSLLLGLVLGVIAQASAAEPTLRSVPVRGLQIGGTTSFSIEGDGLTLEPKLLLPFPAKVALQPQGTDKSAVFAITLDSQISPGWYQLRVQTAQGVSLPVLVSVDRLPQKLMSKSIDSLPVALHGTLSGSSIQEVTFVGQANQVMQIEVEAARLGSKLRPVLHLFGPKRREIAWAWGSAMLGGDCRISSTLPESGTYTIALHDAEYNAAAPGGYRLKVGDFATVDQIYPTAIGANTKSVELIGNHGRSQLKLSGSRSGTIQRLDWPVGQPWTGPQPFLPISSRTEIVEQPGTVTELPNLPVGISGILGKPSETDRYQLAVKPGMKLRFAVFAERIGTPLDTALVLKNAAGVELARNDDSPGSLDPVLEYTVPEKLDSLILGIQDVQGRGGPQAVYRATVDLVKGSSEPASFRLFAYTGRVNVPVRGRDVVPIVVERTEFSGEIAIRPENLPPGFRIQNATIPAGASGTLLELRNAGTSSSAAITKWTGTANGLEREVLLRNHPLEKLQPWLASEIAVASTPAVPGFAIDWKAVPEELAFVATQKVGLSVSVQRSDPLQPVRLSLVTSLLPVLVNNQPDPNRAIRLEKSVEIAPKASEAELVLLVPADLPTTSCDIAVRAEFLSPDKKVVVATETTPVRRVPVREPVAMKFNATQLIAKLDPKLGFVAELAGTVERQPGIGGDIALTAVGLPPGARLETPTIKADAKSFALRVIFPATQSPGEIAGIKLSGTMTPDAKQPNVRVKTRDLEFKVLIPAVKK